MITSQTKVYEEYLLNNELAQFQHQNDNFYNKKTNVYLNGIICIYYFFSLNEKKKKYSKSVF